MTTYSWKSAVSGSWTNAADWTPTGYPSLTPGPFPPVSLDTAIFATGSSNFYTVTTAGTRQYSDELRVIGDRVIFSNFVNGDDGYGGSLYATKGAFVLVGANSSLNYFPHDGIGGGTISADNSIAVDYGRMAAGDASTTNGGLLVEYGSKASLTVIYGITVAQGSAFILLNGAKYSNYIPSSTINGEFIASGHGSAAQLGISGGAGNVQSLDHATVNVFASGEGTVTFDVGAAATLSLKGSFTAANTVAFIGKGATLNLNGSSAEVVSGFDKSDALLVSGTVTKAAFTAGIGGHGSLALYNGATKVETLSLTGNYTGDTFKVAAAASGETRITLQVPAAAGNSTLGGAGFGSLASLVADVYASNDVAAAYVGGAHAAPSVVEPVAYAAAFDVAHTLSDGSTFSFSHSSH